MNKISDLFVNALLADSAYVEGLFDGMSSVRLEEVLTKRMSSTLAKFISDNFEVVAHKESGDGFDSGFDATVWRGRGDYAGQVYVSMQGTTGLQDFLSDVNLALPLGAAARQLVDMVNWWNQITTPIGALATQIQRTPALDFFGVTQLFIPAPSVAGTGLLTSVSSVQVNGHSLGGYLASAFARLFGDRAGGVVINGVTTFNSAGFAPGSELAFGKLELALGIGATIFKSSKQTNVFAKNGISVTTNSFYFNQIGTRVPIFNEVETLVPNHYINKLTDAMALYDLFSKISKAIDTTDPAVGLNKRVFA